MTRDLPWPLDVTQTVVYRPVEARDFTCGRHVQVYCCLVSYQRHCHVRSVAHVVVLTVVVVVVVVVVGCRGVTDFSATTS